MASSRIKGITIEIGGETTKLGKALEEAEKSSKSLQTELKGVNTLLKMDPGNVDLLRQKQELLTQSIAATEDKLGTLRSTMAKIESGEIEVTEEQFRDLQREIISTEQKLENLKEESKKFGSVFKQQVQAAADKVTELGSKVEEAGKKMGTLSTASAAGLGVAITNAATLEEATNKYLGATGKSIEETERYQKVLQTIHNNNYGEDYADIADKMRIVTNTLGDMPDDKLQSIVEKSYLLQDAYDIDFQESIRAVSALMNQFGISSDEAYELINSGAQNGLNQNQDLADQIAEYSVYYKDLGLNAYDFFGIMTAGAEDGAYQMDYLNDAIKEFGIRTKDNSDSTKAAFKALGFDADELSSKFAKGGTDAQNAFVEVTTALMNVKDEVKRNELGVALFGTKWEDLGEDAVRAMTGTYDQVEILGTTVEETANTMYGGTANKAKTAVRSIQNAFAELGNAILPILAPIVEKVAELATKFSNLNPVVQKIVVVILAIVAALAPVIIIIGKIITAVGTIIPLLSKLAPIFGIIKTAISGLFTLIMAHPVIAIITAVIAAIILLWNKCEWFRDLVAALFEWLKVGIQLIVDFVKLYIDLIVQYFTFLWETIKAIFSVVVDWFKTLFEAVKIVITTIWDSIVLYFQMIWDNIKLIFSVVVDYFKMIFQTAVDSVKLVFSSIIGYFQTIWETIKGIFSVVKDVLTGDFQGAWDGIKGIVDKWKSYFQGVWDGIKGVFSHVTNWFKDTFSKAWQAVKNVFSTGGKIFDGIKEGIANVFKTVVNGIIGGINKVIAVPFNAINGMLNKIRNAEFLGIAPFKGMWKQNPLSVPEIPKLKVGTNYVPNDEMLALLHKGESVVPAKYNPSIDNTHMKNAMFDALTDFTNVRSQNSSEISTLTTLLNKYMPEIVANMGRGVYLDGRTLVGELTPEIDARLGSLAAQRKRGV